MKQQQMASLVLGCAMGVACMSASADAGKPAHVEIGAYRTQLFNLLSQERNIVDGKSHYQRGFAKQFDALLASSRLAKADKTGISLKKRLLSGPAPEPALQVDLSTGAQRLVYDACQAHRCDEIFLRLLYDPASRRMVGKLNLEKQSEFLGAPSAGEQRLLERTR